MKNLLYKLLLFFYYRNIIKMGVVYILILLLQISINAYTQSDVIIAINCDHVSYTTQAGILYEQVLSL